MCSPQGGAGRCRWRVGVVEPPGEGTLPSPSAMTTMCSPASQPHRRSGPTVGLTVGLSSSLSSDRCRWRGLALRARGPGGPS